MPEVPTHLTREELLVEAKNRGITGVSQATKADIWAALEADGYQTEEAPVAEETVEETTDPEPSEVPEGEQDDATVVGVGGFTGEELTKAQEEADAAFAETNADLIAKMEAEVEAKIEEQGDGTTPAPAAKGGPDIITVSGELGKAQTVGPFEKYTEVHTARGTFALREGETLTIPSGSEAVKVNPAS